MQINGYKYLLTIEFFIYCLLLKSLHYNKYQICQYLAIYKEVDNQHQNLTFSSIINVKIIIVNNEISINLEIFIDKCNIRKNYTNQLCDCEKT